MSLPRGWASACLGDVVVDRVRQDEPTTEPVSYIDIGSIDRERKTIQETQEVTILTAPTRARQWVRDGDVLVSMTRPNLNAVALVPKTLDGAVASTGFDVLRSPGILPGWIYYRVRSQAFVQDVCADVQGVVYPAIRPPDVRRHELPIPPRAEQRRIIDALDSYVSRLDAAVGSLERAQAKLKAYRASVLKAAVEGRLVPTEAELARKDGRSYEPADVLLQKILKERRRRWEEAELAKMKAAGKAPKDDNWKAKYEEPEPPDTSTLPCLPEGWCWTSLGQAFQVTVGATPSRAKQEYWGGTIPWVSSGEVAFCRITRTAETITDAGLEDSSTKMNPRGSVLVGMIGEGKTRGQTAILDIDACGNQNAAAIWVSETDCVSDYVYYYMMGEYQQTRRRGSGNNQPALNKSRVEAIPLPLPPAVEQRQIVDALDLFMSLAIDCDQAVEREGQRANRLRQSILKWAFEGKLVDHDPADEPADALLARIRVERAVEAPSKPKPRRSRKLKAAS